jgi:hypothetical protein
MISPSKTFNHQDRSPVALGLAVIALALSGCGQGGGAAVSSAPAPASSAVPVVDASAPASAPPGPPIPAGWTLYKAAGFTIGLPPGFTPDATHDYQDLGPGKDIHGVAFTIPAALAKGTNLSDDSYIAVETLPGLPLCVAAPFLSDPESQPPVIVGRRTYLTATATDAGAGNLHEETVYALQRSSPCLAVRYFIHSTNIGNYDPGTVKAFDEKALLARFDAIRNTLHVVK